MNSLCEGKPSICGISRIRKSSSAGFLLHMRLKLNVMKLNVPHRFSDGSGVSQTLSTSRVEWFQKGEVVLLLFIFKGSKTL